MDGRINFPCECDAVEDAFHHFAQSIGYDDWAAFSKESGYTHRDITATRIVDERKVFDPSYFSGEYVTKQQESAITSAYRWLLGNRT
jgi:hypothetical protein